MGRIVWIAGYPKSGNTWVRAFLHGLLAPPGTPFDINRMNRVTGNEAAMAHFQGLDPRPWHAWTPAEIAAMRPAAQAALAARHPYNVFCKTHLARTRVFGHATIAAAVTAGAVYLLRNPLDVAVSYADHQSLPLDAAIALMNLAGHTTPTTASHVGEPMGSWSENVESWTGGEGPLHVMRYEDMLADPHRAFAALARFLGLGAPRARLRRAVAACSFAALARQEERHGFVERPPGQARFFRAGRAGGWRAALSPAQAQAIVARHGAVMRRFGYLEGGSLRNGAA